MRTCLVINSINKINVSLQQPTFRSSQRGTLVVNSEMTPSLTGAKTEGEVLIKSLEA